MKYSMIALLAVVVLVGCTPNNDVKDVGLKPVNEAVEKVIKDVPKPVVKDTSNADKKYFSSSDLPLSFEYPNSWTVMENGKKVFLNSEGSANILTITYDHADSTPLEGSITSQELIEPSEIGLDTVSVVLKKDGKQYATASFFEGGSEEAMYRKIISSIK